jgi:hypothetical protein
MVRVTATEWGCCDEGTVQQWYRWCKIIPAGYVYDILLFTKKVVNIKKVEVYKM